MTATYRYAIEDRNSRATRDATEEEAEACRLFGWQSAMDLPEGTEFAGGQDPESGKIVKVYRIAEPTQA